MMGRRGPRWVGVAGWLVVAPGCFGPDHVERTELPPPPPDDPDRGRLATDEDNLYGPDGLLLESDASVAGLVLPKGLEVVRETERDHVYTTRVPLTAVQKYFGPRLTTTDVSRVGAGIIYRVAVPRGVEGGQVKMDVSILPGSRGRTRVQVVELPPPPVVPDDPAARRAMFERIQREAPVLD